MGELLPCPFCGSTDIYCEDAGHKTDVWFVQCNNCCATFPHFDSKEEAISAWNTRTPDVVPKSEVERLIDKWIGDNSLTQDEKTLRLIEALRDEAERYERYYFNHEYDKLIAEAKSEVAREIIDETLDGLQYEIDREDKLSRNALVEGDTAGCHIHQYAEERLETLKTALLLWKATKGGVQK